MSARGPLGLLYVTADPDDRARLIAAVERRADGRMWFLPDPTRVSARDPRGRRTTLGGLLRAHGAEGPDDLVDMAVHLLPLSNGAGAADDAAAQPRVELRAIGIDRVGVEGPWPAPDGGSFELVSAPLALPAGRQAALLASAGAPGGPWIRPCEPLDENTRNLLSLFAELGVRVLGAGPPLAARLDGLLDEQALELDREELLEPLRKRVRAALLRGAAFDDPADEAGEVSVLTEASTDHIRWTFRIDRPELTAEWELSTARYSHEAVADLLAVLDAPLQPYWLLLFEDRPELGPYFVGSIDARRYLAENLERLEDPA